MLMDPRSRLLIVSHLATFTLQRRCTPPDVVVEQACHVRGAMATRHFGGRSQKYTMIEAGPMISQRVPHTTGNQDVPSACLFHATQSSWCRGMYISSVHRGRKRPSPLCTTTYTANIVSTVKKEGGRAPRQDSGLDDRQASQCIDGNKSLPCYYCKYTAEQTPPRKKRRSPSDRIAISRKGVRVCGTASGTTGGMGHHTHI